MSLNRESHSEPLVGAMAKNGMENTNLYIMAITINIPCTRRYESLSSIEQKRIYYKLVADVKNKIYRNLRYDLQFKYIFEFTKRGNVHLHGFVYLDIGQKIPFISAVMKDIIVYAYRFLKRDVKNVSLKIFNNDYGITINTPMVHMEYIDNEDKFKKWEEYMYKLFPHEPEQI